LSPFTFNIKVPAMSISKATITPPALEIEADADSPQRWTAKRKATLVIDILQGKTTAAEAARQHALTLAEVEQWTDDFITQGTEALRSHPRDLAQQFEAERKTLLAKVGELTLHVDLLKKAHRYLGKDLPEGICQH
jgi:transposase-like protein